MAGPVHYEVFIRKTAPSPWSLLMATENRAHAVETAEDMLADRRAAAVRVTKETLDTSTGEFSSLTLLMRGAPEQQKKRVIPEDEIGPRCATPRDLYPPHARELIGRVLEDWLVRQGATAFELLHRPDLAEKLEASGMELQHAIQKVAVPESQAVGQSVHELVRHYQKLADASIERVISAGRKGLFPDAGAQPLAQIAEKLAGTADRGFIMGGVVARFLIGARGGRAKLDRLMTLADQAPVSGPTRAMVLVEIEQLACELLGGRIALADILGPSLDHGASLLAVVRMISPGEVEALIAQDSRLALLAPAVDGPAARLAVRLAAGEFPLLSAALGRMVLRELMSPRRLRPSDATGEIDILRALALALTATPGRLLTADEIQDAFAERSKSLVTADFVAAFTQSCSGVVEEAEALIRLCENVTGTANKRSAARWLNACVSALRFETAMRQPSPSLGQPATQRLLILAHLQRGVRSAALNQNDSAEVCAQLGRIGGLIETDAKIIAQLVRAPAAPLQKLTLLLRMAAGDAAPLGPAADLAKTEALKLLRSPETRQALAATPEVLTPLKSLMRTAGLAA